MLGLGLRMGEVSARGRGPYADHALALDFVRGVYRSGSVVTGDVTALPGYGFARSGVQTETAAGGGPLSFAANVPAIVPGAGYWARAADGEHGDTLLTLAGPVPGAEDFVIYAAVTFAAAASALGYALTFDDGTVANRMLLFRRSTDGDLRGFGPGGAIASGVAQPGLGRAVLALRHQSGVWTAAARAADGVTAIGASVTQGSLAALNTIRIGYGLNGTAADYFLNDRVEKVGLLRAALSDASLLDLVGRA